MTTIFYRRLVLATLLSIAILLCGYTVVFGGIALQKDTEINVYKQFSFFNATTTSATSTAGGDGYFVIAGAKKVELFFTHGGTATSSTGTSTMRVQVSPDAVNWYDFSKLVQATSTNMQPNVTIAGATSTVHYGMNIDYGAFYAIRCIVLEGTVTGASGDGEHTCTAAAIF